MSSGPDRLSEGTILSKSVSHIIQTLVISGVFYIVVIAILHFLGISRITTEVIVISMVPFLVFLIVSGRLQEVTLPWGSMRFRREARRPIDYWTGPALSAEAIQVGEEQLPTSDEVEKPSIAMDATETIQRIRPKLLEFRIGNEYDEMLIREYFHNIPSIRFVFFTSPDGSFEGLMEAPDFVSYIGDGTFDVAEAVRTGEILNFVGIITESIQSDTTRAEALERMSLTDQDLLVIVDADDQFLGVITPDRISGNILQSLFRIASS